MKRIICPGTLWNQFLCRMGAGFLALMMIVMAMIGTGRGGPELLATDGTGVFSLPLRTAGIERIWKEIQAGRLHVCDKTGSVRRKERP